MLRKVNRCLTEGRRSFLSRYATIESGAECELWLPVISAMVDGEASAEQLMALRPHLRNCPGCRTTLKTLQGSSEPLAGVLPVPLVAGAGGSEEQLMNVFTRVYETIAGGFHERAVYSLTKAQTVFEAASAGKVAAVAASAAAVAGGGYATVERNVPKVPGQQKPAKVLTHQPVRDPRPAVPVATTSPSSPARRTSRRTATPAKPSRTVREFGPAARKKADPPEFGPVDAQDPQFTRAAAAQTSAAAAAPSSSPSPAPSAPEFGGASAAPEFGG